MASADLSSERHAELREVDPQFLEKISPVIAGEVYRISSPRLAQDKRLQRRLAFRNQIFVYLRTCSATGNRIFSMFPEGTPFPVYENEVWWGDSWDAIEHAREYNFSREFFEQFTELRNVCPHRARSIVYAENSDYCNNANKIRNSYLVFNSAEVEDCMYCEKTPHCRDCIDCTECNQCELCFDCTSCSSCYNVQSSFSCEGCSDSIFLQNCRSCSNCFGCVNLRHKEYYVFNRPYTAEQYQAYLADLALDSFQERSRIWDSCRQSFRNHPVPHIQAVFTENVSGNCLLECKNTFDSFFVSNAEDVRCGFGLYDNIKDAQEFSFFGCGAELIYECTQCGINVFNLRFCHDCWENNKNLLYCWMCSGCNDCFGCVSLRNRQYCILNKQYTRDEYEQLLPRIIEHMSTTGEWGEFFPLSLSPHPYNRSVAQRYFAMTASEAQAQALWWYNADDEETSDNLSICPDGLPETDDPILAMSVVSGRPFRITSEEIHRYRRLGVPLPRLTYDERMEQRMSYLGGIQLYRRCCGKTEREILTPYSEELFPIVWERSVFEDEFS